MRIVTTHSLREAVKRSRGRQLTVSALALFALAAITSADEIELDGGVTIEGTVLPISGLNARTIAEANKADVPVAALWLIDDGVRRYFVPKRFAGEPIPEDPLSRLVRWDLKHERNGNGGIPQSIGAFPHVEFDQFGRRMVTLNLGGGRVANIQQAITQIEPDSLRVESTSHQWTIGLDTAVLPDETLSSILNQTIDPKRLDDRKALVVFYVQARRYRSAQKELDRLAANFPEQAAWVEELRLEVSQLTGLDVLREVERRRAAGQHAFAARAAASFPADRVSADVLADAQRVAAEFAQVQVDAVRAAELLDMLPEGLPDEQRQALAPHRAAIVRELHPDSLSRLQPFLRAESDASLSADQKLALAYSGWVLGESNAITDLNEALRLWEARFLVLEYLRTDDDPAHRERTLASLQQTEGVSVARVSQMIPLLPPPIAPPTLQPVVPTPVEVIDPWDKVQHRYWASLPPEYSPQHRYPLLVVLRGQGVSHEQELRWWTGDEHSPGMTQRHGYIAIAPEYAAEKQGQYDYSAEAHAAVLAAIRDARQRYRIDSDRIVLAGHGMGADACFDIGLAHPDFFAAVVPIAGVCEKYSPLYKRNQPGPAFYVVGGERDGVKLEQNAEELSTLMSRGRDMVYCEYKQRGYEPYPEELSRVFDWIAARRRAPIPRDWKLSIYRASDTQFFWLQHSGLPARLSQTMIFDGPERTKPPRYELSGKITPGNTVYIDSPAEHIAVWLSPDLVNFDERLKVHFKGRQAYSDFLAPSLGDLLESLRLTGDRERLYWGKVEL